MILHDLPLDDTKTPTQLVQPALGASHGDTEWPLLSITMLEAPYSVPDQFDFVHLQFFVYAKRAEAIDHIWSLREHASYLADVALGRS